MTIYHIFGFDTTRGGVCFLKEESEAQYMHKKNGKIVKRDILMTVTRRVIGRVRCVYLRGNVGKSEVDEKEGRRCVRIF